MRHQINSYLLFWVFLIFLSCNRQRKFNYHDEISDNKEIIARNHISKSTEIQIKYDSASNPIWKRVERINFFNEKGLCVKQIEPKYDIKFKTTGEDIHAVESSNYLGFSDTIYFEFDDLGHLIKKVESTFDHSGLNYHKKTEFIYDVNGNVISDCTHPEDAEIQCIYSDYVYGSDMQILSRKDSTDFEIEWDLSKAFQYQYDDSNNLVFDGNYKYILDKSANTIEMIPQRKYFGGIKYSFDEKHRKIKETRIYEVGGKWKESGEITYYKYDAKDLLIEKKILVNDKMKYLVNYNYE